MKITSSHSGKPSASTAVINRIAEWCSYLFLLAVIITGYEVVARYVFNAPSVWVHETIVMLVGVCFSVGGFVVLHDKAHITITALYDAVPETVRRLFDVLIALVSLAYLSGLSYAAWVVAKQAWKLGETSGTAWNPPLPIVLKTALFISAVIMALIVIQQLLDAVRRLRGGAQHVD